MLNQYVHALPSLLAPALVVMIMKTLLSVGEGKDIPKTHRLRTYGVVVGVIAAVIFAVLRDMVIITQRSTVNFPILWVCLVTDIALLFVILRADKITYHWQENSRKIHAANTLAAVNIAFATFYSLQEMLVHLAAFVDEGKTPFTSEVLLRVLGFILGVISAIIVASIFRSMYKPAIHKAWIAASVLCIVLVIIRHLGVLIALGFSMNILHLNSFLFNILVVIVNNDLLFVIGLTLAFIIPAMASFYVGMKMPIDRRNPALARASKAYKRAAKIGSGFSTFAMILVMLSLTVGVAKANEVPTLSKPEAYSLHNNIAEITFKQVSDGHLHRFAYTAKDGTKMRFIIIKKNGGAYGVGLDACETCGDAGYFEKDGKIICMRCKVALNLATIGFKGGCNPIPFPYQVAHGKIIIHTAQLDALSSHFSH